MPNLKFIWKCKEFILAKTILNKKFKIGEHRSSRHGAEETNVTRNDEVVGSIPGLAQWVKEPVLPWAVV